MLCGAARRLRPVFHHLVDLCRNPLYELLILRPAFRIFMRNKVVMSIVEDYCVPHWPHERALVNLTMHQVMPSKKRPV